MKQKVLKLTSPSGGILKTAGKYCDADIAIAPKLQEKTTSESGEIVPDDGYAGLSKVSVDVDGKIEEAFEAGKKSEYDAFWDSYQKGGQRIEYSLAFAGDGWYDDNFRPKYDIVPTYSYEIFKLCRITDLEKILNDNHIKLDFSKSGRISGAFTTAQLLTVVPEIDASQTTYVALSSLFQDCFKLHTIRKIKLREDGSNTFSACFYRCNSLKNIVVEGTIGTNIDFQYSPLSNGSISSIINALSNSSTGTSVIFSLAAVNTAFETSPGAADGSTSSEWLALTATKPNWTFSLV